MMMRSVCRTESAGCAGLAVLLLAACWASQAPAEPLFTPVAAVSVNKGLERRQVAQSERQWKQALMAGDAAMLTSLLSDSYVGIGPDGTIFNKTEEIDASVSGSNRLTRVHVEDRKIRIYGTTAVVTSKVDVAGTFAGKPVQGQYRYTRVWAFSRGQWRVVSFEANRVDSASGGQASD